MFWMERPDHKPNAFGLSPSFRRRRGSRRSSSSCFSPILFVTAALTLFSAAAASRAETPASPSNRPAAKPAESADRIPLPKRLRLKPLRTLPHDDQSFCQGLFYEFDAADGKGVLYESSGHYGRSEIRRVDLETGRTLARTPLKKEFFGEGAAAVGDRIYQLTWREGVCFVYDKDSLRPVDQFRYKGEGWGLAFDGTDLIVSDGSDSLTFFDPVRRKTGRRLRVFWRNPKNGKKEKIAKLNELEFIEGEIWANVYQTTFIVRIDPKSGEVIEFLNFARYVPKDYAGSADFVLNGIAWDREGRKLYLTGKNWPILYELGIENDPVSPRPPRADRRTSPETPISPRSPETSATPRWPKSLETPKSPRWPELSETPRWSKSLETSSVSRGDSSSVHDRKKSS